jgi:hypothetical protein
MTKCVTNFTRTALHHWTASKAIMEFVQNWLDSDAGRSYEFGETYLVLKNENIRVSNKFLLMGASDKRGCENKRGQYGMGSGQALVVLTDLGINVEIQNNDIIWTPYWEYLERFDAEVLVVSEKRANVPHRDFVVTVTNLTPDIVEEVKQRCLMFQERDVLHSTSVGDIIDNSNGEGEVFCGEIYVCQNSQFKYSYNFKPKMLKLSQDRDAVSQWDLQELTAKMINMTGDAEFITEAIKANTVDTHRLNGYAPSDRWTKKEVNDKLAAEFLEANGPVIVTSDYDEHQAHVRLGNKSVYVINEREVQAIQASSLYQDALDNVTLIEKEPFSALFEVVENWISELTHVPDNVHKALDEMRERVYNNDYN